MKLYIVICTFNAIRINSFILKGPNNMQVKNAHQKVGENLDEADFEMIDRQQLQRFQIGAKDKKFYDLNKLASKEYGKTLKKSMNWFKLKDVRVPTRNNKAVGTGIPMTRTLTTHNLHKRGVTEASEPYDYDKFLNEYYEESILEEKLNGSYRPEAVESQDLLHRLKRMGLIDVGNARNANMNGLNLFHQLMIGYRNQQYSKKELAKKIWNVVKIWLFIYLVVAVPLWSTKGWCCCCLCCNFFHPRRTIEKAKIYLIQNPPGILKTRKGQTLYEPTEEERESYKQFEHLIEII